MTTSCDHQDSVGHKSREQEDLVSQADLEAGLHLYGWERLAARCDACFENQVSTKLSEAQASAEGRQH
jgi:hypothetical protein